MIPNIRQPNIRQDIRPNISADRAIGPTLHSVGTLSILTDCVGTLSVLTLFITPLDSKGVRSEREHE